MTRFRMRETASERAITMMTSKIILNEIRRTGSDVWMVFHKEHGNQPTANKTWISLKKRSSGALIGFLEKSPARCLVSDLPPLPLAARGQRFTRTLTVSRSAFGGTNFACEPCRKPQERHANSPQIGCSQAIG
jgi:hypothetical protein